MLLARMRVSRFRAGASIKDDAERPSWLRSCRTSTRVGRNPGFAGPNPQWVGVRRSPAGKVVTSRPDRTPTFRDVPCWFPDAVMASDQRSEAAPAQRQSFRGGWTQPKAPRGAGPRDAAAGERTSTSSPPPLAREPGHAGGPSPRRDFRGRLPAPWVLTHLLRNVVQSMRGQLGRCLLAGRLTDPGQFALPLRSGSSRNGAGACGR